MAARHEEGCNGKTSSCIYLTCCLQRSTLSNDDVEVAKGHRVSGNILPGADFKTDGFVEEKVVRGGFHRRTVQVCFGGETLESLAPDECYDRGAAPLFFSTLPITLEALVKPLPIADLEQNKAATG